MATLASLFASLITKLDATHVGAGFIGDGTTYLPNFVKSRSGVERHFTSDSQLALQEFAEALYQAREQYRKVARLEEFLKAVRTCVADLHADNAFSDSKLDDKDKLRLYDGELSRRVLGLSRKYTHVFPAHTLRLEQLGTLELGPVKILPASAWLGQVDYPTEAKERLGLPSNWKEAVLARLNGAAAGDEKLPWAAEDILSVLRGCNAVVSVDVEGRELAFSREIARLAARTALDGIALLARGGRKLFLQQALRDERLPPVDVHSVVVTDGQLWAPGYRLTERFNHIEPQRIATALSERPEELAVLKQVVAALVEPSTHSHPNLAARWATALDWFAEGCRETSDAVAVTKLASALDVLACGGKDAGIRELLCHLTGMAPSDVVVPRRGLTLTEVVSRVYNDGRSKLLHGTHFDRLEKFSTERLQAEGLGVAALTELLVRLPHYTGPDTDKAFRAIGPAPA